ncbi:MAG: helix-turn-helix transcriptional regulator [Spirochaetales bacterium]|nr:helix-turn-helix transcriptional regulator [Spirochaetales bacterium]
MDFSIGPRAADAMRRFSLARFRGAPSEAGSGSPEGLLVVLERGTLDVPAEPGAEVTVPFIEAPGIAIAADGRFPEDARGDAAGFALRFEPGFPGTLGAGPTGSGAVRVARLEPRELSRAGEIAAALFSETGPDDAWRDTLLGALVAELFALCFRALVGSRPYAWPRPAVPVISGRPELPAFPRHAAPDGRPWRVEDAVSWAAEHCAEAHSLDFYVTRCATNPSDFSRRFKALAGCPLFEYVNRKRVERACVLLKNTELSILEVSLAVGYNNLSFFNRYFLRLMGLQPRAWRERARK